MTEWTTEKIANERMIWESSRGQMVIPIGQTPTSPLLLLDAIEEQAKTIERLSAELVDFKLYCGDRQCHRKRQDSKARREGFFRVEGGDDD